MAGAETDVVPAPEVAWERFSKFSAAHGFALARGCGLLEVG
jgi:hypothetical protein